MDPLYNMNKTDGDESPCKRTEVFKYMIQSILRAPLLWWESPNTQPLNFHFTLIIPLSSPLTSFIITSPPFLPSNPQSVTCSFVIIDLFPLSLLTAHFTHCTSSCAYQAIKYMQYKLQLKVTICEQKSYHVLH